MPGRRVRRGSGARGALVAPLFGCSPATVCRVIQRLRPLLAIEPSTCPPDAVDRLWMVDAP